MQIDSIRYAIDRIEDEKTQEWALGALIVTVSAIASNHAGHFAQPKRVDESSVINIIEKRRKSVWLEFSRRFYAIAAESERYPFEVHILEGPWQCALEKIHAMDRDNIIVYLDAPYKRDEYSRYYHVLETIALYDYPSSERKGRLRSKNNGERFKTEYSSRNVNQVENSLEDTIVTILQFCKVCAWSYSNNGIASILSVVSEVVKKIPCRVYLYSIPHKHNSQRRKGTSKKTVSRGVVEYCIVFLRS